MSSTKGFPYFLGPDEHRLHGYYKALNRIWVFAAVVLVLVNEFFIRQGLPSYRASPDQPWARAVLAMNGEFEHHIDGYLFGVPVIVALLYVFVSMPQPKWGPRPLVREMKKGVPFQIGYEKVNFYFENRMNEVCFFGWHYLLMLFSFVAGIVLPCMFFGLIRSLGLLAAK